jgi:hypothetical protein
MFFRMFKMFLLPIQSLQMSREFMIILKVKSIYLLYIYVTA